MRLTRIQAVALCLVMFGCGQKPVVDRADHRGAGPITVRLAFFPNVTHAAALVGTGRGTFAAALGSAVKLEEQTFNAGPAEIEGLFADQVDIGYVGPGPAVNGFIKSRGKALRVVAGAASGGASLVVRGDSGITEIRGLAGKRVADPQTGGTQDISLRHALQQVGLNSADKGGNVSVLPTSNADTLTLFVKKELDAAWVPEPWVSRLVAEGGGKLLVDERDLWPNKRFATTVVIVRKRFLDEHPDIVRKVLAAHVETVAWIQKNPNEASRLVGERIKALTSKGLKESILHASASRTEVTYDPLRESVLTFADWSKALGYQREGRGALSDLFDLKPLNDTLAAAKLTAVP